MNRYRIRIQGNKYISTTSDAFTGQLYVKDREDAQEFTAEETIKILNTMIAKGDQAYAELV
jgi:hypothetical protein